MLAAFPHDGFLDDSQRLIGIPGQSPAVGVLGVRGVPIPGVEFGVAASAVVLGAMILLAARPPLWVAAIIVGAFAIFHGHAHGTELPHAARPLAYGAGFVLSTGLLHVTGISIGLINRWQFGERTLRVMGAAISVAGFFLLFALVKGAQA